MKNIQNLESLCIYPMEYRWTRKDTILTILSIITVSPSAANPIVMEYLPVTYKIFVISSEPLLLKMKILASDNKTQAPKMMVVKTEAAFGDLFPKNNVIINPKIGRTGITQINLSKPACLLYYF